MKKNKLLSILLIICMLTTLMPTLAWADEADIQQTGANTEQDTPKNPADEKKSG